MRSHYSLIIAVVVSLGLCASAFAQSTPTAATPAVDPAAVNILKQTAAAYANLKSYSDDATTKTDDGPTVHVATRYAAPGHYHFTVKRSDVTYDVYFNGKLHTVTSSACPGKYVQTPQKSTRLWILPSLTGGYQLPLEIATYFGGPTPDGVTLSLGPTKIDHGVAVDVVHLSELAAGNGTAHSTLLIGKSDHLIRQITSDYPGGFGFWHVDFKFDNIRIDPALSDADLSFEPAKGWTPFSLQSRGPSTADTKLVGQLALRAPFTLVYKETTKDVRTAAQRRHDLYDREHMYASQVESGQMTQSSADSYLADECKEANAPKTFNPQTITLSSNGSELFYNAKESGTRRYERVNDGTRFHEPLKNDVIMVDNTKACKSTQAVDTRTDTQVTGGMDVTPSPNGMDLEDCPILGLNLPFMQVVTPLSSTERDYVSDVEYPVDIARADQGGIAMDVLNTHVGGTLKTGARGEALVWIDAGSGKPRVSRILLGGLRYPESHWTLESPRSFGGVEIPQLIDRTDYNNNLPTTEYTYTLVKADLAPLPAKSFDWRTYVADGQEIQFDGMKIAGVKDDGYGRYIGIYQASDHGDLMTLPIRTEKHREERLARIDQENAVAIAAAEKAGGTPTADKALAVACAQARAQNKTVMVIFHATWCGPCHILERYLNRPTVKPIIDRHYVVVYLDEFEPDKSKALDNVGALALMKKYGGENLGIPYQAFVAPDGTLLFKGDKTDGWPETKPECDAFIYSLKKTSPLSIDEVRQLRQQLTAKA